MATLSPRVDVLPGVESIVDGVVASLPSNYRIIWWKFHRLLMLEMTTVVKGHFESQSSIFSETFKLAQRTKY